MPGSFLAFYRIKLCNTERLKHPLWLVRRMGSALSPSGKVNIRDRRSQSVLLYVFTFAGLLGPMPLEGIALNLT